MLLRRPVRHGVLWLAICGLSAIPSFWMAVHEQANIPAMLVGISLFVVAYSFVSISLSGWIQQRKVVCRAIQAGFGFRLILSAISVVALMLNVPDGMKMLLLHDGISGQIALVQAKHMFGLLSYDRIEGHAGVTFVATVLQGMLLNLLLLPVMTVFYVGLKLFVTFAAIMSPKGETA